MEKGLQLAYTNELIVQRIITEQTENGVYFNVRRANRYLLYIARKKEQLYNRIRPVLRLEVRRPYSVPVSKPFKKDGTYSAAVLKWFPDNAGDVSGAFTRIGFTEPDIGSRKKLQQQLLHLGWKPRAFTEKGSPKLTVDGQPCPSLNAIGSEVGADIALWFTLSHRESQIKGWLDRLRDDQRLSAEANTIGTPTYRFRHKGVVNVPKAARQVIFGKQMRSLFTVPRAAEGYRQYLEWKEKQDEIQG